MVKLLVGHKGSGKTKTMINLANRNVEESKGSIIFINKNSRLIYDLSYKIRVICMEDFVHITNEDEYIGYTDAYADGWKQGLMQPAVPFTYTGYPQAVMQAALKALPQAAL